MAECGTLAWLLAVGNLLKDTSSVCTLCYPWLLFALASCTITGMSRLNSRKKLSRIHHVFNFRYPARVFPGDTLCYVTGMAFAVVGIQAHFSKTLLLFFMPQIFNFLLSCPQLFGLVPCPRHRVPRLAGWLLFFIHDISLKILRFFFLLRFDANTNLLHPSKALFLTPPSRLTTFVLHLFSAFGLTELTLHPKTGIILEASNLTILNFFLLRLGPMNEKKLVKVLMCSQVSVLPIFKKNHAQACWNASLQKVACSILAFVIRYGLAWLVYDGDRR